MWLYSILNMRFCQTLSIKMTYDSMSHFSVVFICISETTYDSHYLCMFVSICILSSVKCPLIALAHFFRGFFMLFSLNCKSSLYILGPDFFVLFCQYTNKIPSLIIDFTCYMALLPI